MADKKVSIVRAGPNNRTVGKDTTTRHSDGSSTTVHQKAYAGTFGNTVATKITGVTQNSADGKSKNK